MPATLGLFCLCLFWSVSTTFISIPFRPRVHLYTRAFPSSSAGVSWCTKRSALLDIPAVDSPGLQMWDELFWGLGKLSHTLDTTVLRSGAVSAVLLIRFNLFTVIQAKTTVGTSARALSHHLPSSVSPWQGQTSSLTIPVALRRLPTILKPLICQCQDG